MQNNSIIGRISKKYHMMNVCKWLCIMFLNFPDISLIWKQMANLMKMTMNYIIKYNILKRCQL